MIKQNTKPLSPGGVARKQCIQLKTGKEIGPCKQEWCKNSKLINILILIWFRFARLFPYILNSLYNVTKYVHSIGLQLTVPSVMHAAFMQFLVLKSPACELLQ